MQLACSRGCNQQQPQLQRGSGFEASDRSRVCCRGCHCVSGSKLRLQPQLRIEAAAEAGCSFGCSHGSRSKPRLQPAAAAAPNRSRRCSRSQPVAAAAFIRSRGCSRGCSRLQPRLRSEAAAAAAAAAGCSRGLYPEPRLQPTAAAAPRLQPAATVAPDRNHGCSRSYGRGSGSKPRLQSVAATAAAGCSRGSDTEPGL